MFIKNLSILDYFKFKSIIKSTIEKIYGNFNILAIFNIKKIVYKDSIIMILLCESTDYSTLEVKETLFVSKKKFEKENKFYLKGYNNCKLSIITRDKTFIDKFSNTIKSNLVLKANLSKLNLNYRINEEYKLFDLKKDVKRRCEIQNSIFFGKDRIPLQNKDIIYECKKENYIPELTYFLLENSKYIGYGQIIFTEDKYFVVNFGIINEFRNEGKGRNLLNLLLIKAKEYGLDDIYIKVDKNNTVALKLYENIGFEFFQEIYICEVD